VKIDFIHNIFELNFRGLYNIIKSKPRTCTFYGTQYAYFMNHAAGIMKTAGWMWLIGLRTLVRIWCCGKVLVLCPFHSRATVLEHVYNSYVQCFGALYSNGR